MRARVLNFLDGLTILANHDFPFRVLDESAYSGRNLRSMKALADHDPMALDAADIVREYEAQRSLRAFQAPFAQRLHHSRQKRNKAVAGFAFGRVDCFVLVDSLVDMDLALGQIGVDPLQRPELAAAQTCRYSEHQEDPPAAVRKLHHGLNLVRGRN